MLNFDSDDEDGMPVIPAVSQPCEAACTRGYMHIVTGTAIEDVSQDEIDRRRVERLARQAAKPSRAKRPAKRSNRPTTLLDVPPAPPPSPSPKYCGHVNGRCLDVGVKCPLVDGLGYPIGAMRRLQVRDDGTVADVDSNERFTIVQCEGDKRRLEVCVG